jgi:hypothetical protein
MHLGFWLSAATFTLAHNPNITITTTSTLVIPVVTFNMTTHLTPVPPLSTIAYPDPSILALVATLTATSTPTTSTTRTIRDARPSLGKIYASNSSASNTTTSTVAAVPSPSMYGKEGGSIGSDGEDGRETAHTTAAVSRPEAKQPAWMVPVTGALLCYDFLAVTAFAWCWVMGWFWWWKREGEGGRGQRTRDRRAHALRGERNSLMRVLMNENVDWEMRRLGMV